MRVVVLVIVLLIVGAVGYVGASIWLEWQPTWGFFQMARGYSPAKTPEEALEKFAKAVKERDYVSASEYCAGDYSKQMHKGAAAAKALAVAIDNLEQNMINESIKSNKCKVWLRRLEPFPKFIQSKVTVKPKDDNDTKAAATFWEDVTELQPEAPDWSVDWRPFRALAGGAAHPLLEKGAPCTFELVKENNAWKIVFAWTTTPTDQEQRITDLNKYYQDYVRPLDKLKYEIKRDTATKTDLENRLKEEMVQAKPS